MQAVSQDRGKHGAAQELRWAAALACARGSPAMELSYRDVWDAWQRDEDVVRGPGLPADSLTALHAWAGRKRSASACETQAFLA